ncbi:hypothetical protein WK99_32965 [Burkholderia ubonensis]|nr:hypothetical protein WK99_32965 [Burkholderia ubonensis]
MLKRAAIAQIEQAVDLMRHVEDEVEQQRAAQARSKDAAEQAGYEAGTQRAALEYADRLLEASNFISQAALRFEASFSEAVRVAVTRILDEVPDSRIVERLVKDAYQDVANESVVRLVVHTDHRDQIDQVLQSIPDVQPLSVVGDSGVAHRFCRMETTLGSVEMDVDTAIVAVSVSVQRALHAARIDGDPAP